MTQLLKYMMSDNALPTCKQGDGIRLVSGTNIGASQTSCMGQWMAHWLQACRNSSSKDGQLHTDTLTGNIVRQFEGHDCLALDRIKSKEFKEFKLLKVDINQRYSLGCTRTSNSAAEDDPFSDSLRSCETSKIARGKFKITENSSMIRHVELINDETTFSEKGGTQQLTESSIKWKNSGSYCCHGLDISKLDFEHFPMLDINRKIETILASKRKSDFGASVSVKLKENFSLCGTIGTSSLLELAPGSCFAVKEIIGDAKKVMRTYEGFLRDNVEDVDGASSPAIHGCKYQKTNMVACMFSSGLTYVDPINNNLTCIRHNQCSCCSSSKSMTTGIKSKSGSISKGFGSLWTSLNGGSTHLLTESNPADFPYSFSTKGHGSEVKGDSSSRLLLHQRRLSNPDSADLKFLPCKMTKWSNHDMSIAESCQNLKSLNTGERFQKFSSKIKYLLIADKVGKHQCLSEEDSAFSLPNGSTLFKTVTIPTKQDYDKKEKSAVPLEHFVSDETMNCCDDVGAHLIPEHNEFSTKDDTICHHPFHRSSSLLGGSYSWPQKVVIPSNLKNSKPASTSSPEAAHRNPETVMAEEREVEHPASAVKATVSSTESLAADHIVSHVKVSNVSISSPPRNRTSGSETCSRWIKRLQDNHSETLSLCSKRFKKNDKQQTFSRVQNYNPLSYGSHRFMEEEGKCENSMTLSENVLASGDSEESVQLWLRRWCRNDDETSQTTSRPSVPLKLDPEKLSVPLQKFEGKMSASIGAMALMGKAMNNYRPCRFRREEGSLVWNTED